MKRKRLSWNAYLKMIADLGVMIQKDKAAHFDHILAINRGGNIIGTILSHTLDIPLTIITATQELKGYKNVLLCDEISDTGLTLKRVALHLNEAKINYKVATLHMKPDTQYTPDFCISTIKEWIVYPYERED